MSVLAAVDAVEVVVAMGAVLALTTGAGFALRHVLARTRSLQRQILLVMLAALVIGAVAAIVLARLMVLDEDQMRTVLAAVGVPRRGEGRVGRVGERSFRSHRQRDR